MEKNRPQYIEKQLSCVNDYLRMHKVQDHNRDNLFWWWVCYLTDNGWYRGWNLHIDQEVTIAGERKIARVLAGPVSKMDEQTKANYYVQIW